MIKRNRNQLQLSIPDPCSIRWSQMSHVEDGKRHCASCEKVITDFTQMSDEQLLSYFQNNPKTCGMFAPHQLNRTVSEQKKKNSWLGAMLLPALFSLTEANAQEAKPTPAIEFTSDTTKPDIQIPLDDVFHTLKDTLLVSGMVLEVGDSLRENPLTGATLVFHMGDTIRACEVDQHGLFEIKLPHRNVGDTVKVEIRYPGLVHFMELVLVEEPQRTIMKVYPADFQSLPIVGDLDVVQIVPPSPIRNFFWTLVHPRYWFR
jgi:hypothetical protein